MTNKIECYAEMEIDGAAADWIKYIRNLSYKDDDERIDFAIQAFLFAFYNAAYDHQKNPKAFRREWDKWRKEVEVHGID